MWQPSQPNNSIEIRHRTLRWVRVQAEGDVPSARENHTFTYLGKSRGILYGGMDSSEETLSNVHLVEFAENNTIKCLDITDTLDGVPRLESHAAIAIDENRVLIFGGYDEGEHRNKTFILDLSKREWIALELKGSVPSPRCSHSLTRVGSHVILWGGANSEAELADLWVLDLTRDVFEWEEIFIFGPVGRQKHCMVSLNDKEALLFGGGDEKSCFGDTWILRHCPSQYPQWSWEQWKPFSFDPARRREMAAVGWKGNVISVGGAIEGLDEEEEQTLADVTFLVGETKQWQNISPLIESPIPFEGVSGHSLEYLFDREQLLLFGGEADGEYSNEFLILDLKGGSQKTTVVSRSTSKFYYNNPLFYDVTFFSNDPGQPTIHAQQSFLITSSQYFRAMFSHGLKESKTERVTVKEDFASYRLLLRHLFRFDIIPEISLEEIAYVWMLGEHTCDDQLQLLCLKKLQQNLNPETLGTFFHIQDLQSPELEKKIRLICGEYLLAFPASINMLPKDLMMEMLHFLYSPAFLSKAYPLYHMTLKALEENLTFLPLLQFIQKNMDIPLFRRIDKDYDAGPLLKILLGNSDQLAIVDEETFQHALELITELVTLEETPHPKRVGNFLIELAHKCPHSLVIADMLRNIEEFYNLAVDTLPLGDIHYLRLRADVKPDIKLIPHIHQFLKPSSSVVEITAAIRALFPLAKSLRLVKEVANSIPLILECLEKFPELYNVTSRLPLHFIGEFVPTDLILKEVRSSSPAVRFFILEMICLLCCYEEQAVRLGSAGLLHLIFAIFDNPSLADLKEITLGMKVLGMFAEEPFGKSFLEEFGKNETFTKLFTTFLMFLETKASPAFIRFFSLMSQHPLVAPKLVEHLTSEAATVILSQTASLKSAKEVAGYFPLILECLEKFPELCDVVRRPPLHLLPTDSILKGVRSSSPVVRLFILKTICLLCRDKSEAVKLGAAGLVSSIFAIFDNPSLADLEEITLGMKVLGMFADKSITRPFLRDLEKNDTITKLFTAFLMFLETKASPGFIRFFYLTSLHPMVASKLVEHLTPEVATVLLSQTSLCSLPTLKYIKSLAKEVRLCGIEEGPDHLLVVVTQFLSSPQPILRETAWRALRNLGIYSKGSILLQHNLDPILHCLNSEENESLVTLGFEALVKLLDVTNEEASLLRQTEIYPTLSQLIQKFGSSQQIVPLLVDLIFLLTRIDPESPKEQTSLREKIIHMSSQAEVLFASGDARMEE